MTLLLSIFGMSSIGAIIIGLLLSFLSPKIFKGGIAGILGTIGWLLTVIGVIVLILELCGVV